jgi:zinc transport system permease protein
MDNFIINAILAGVGVSLITGLLGCFVVWRKMAYFGDSLSHSALLGIVLGLMAGISASLGIIVVASCFAILLTYLQNKQILSTDTLLGILAHGSLATAMILISFLDNQHFDLHALLFGDILTVTKEEIYLIYTSCLIVYAVILINWQKLVLLTISVDLAGSRGINCFLMQLVFIFLMTITVAVAIKIIGVLLITSMLIIPSATARQLAKSPNQMAVISVFFGVAAVIFGILLSYYLDTPSGPSIVFASVINFILVFAFCAMSFKISNLLKNISKKFLKKSNF